MDCNKSGQGFPPVLRKLLLDTKVTDQWSNTTNISQSRIRYELQIKRHKRFGREINLNKLAQVPNK
jgi:hypothetical protein